MVTLLASFAGPSHARGMEPCPKVQSLPQPPKVQQVTTYDATGDIGFCGGTMRWLLPPPYMLIPLAKYALLFGKDTFHVTNAEIFLHHHRLAHPVLACGIALMIVANTTTPYLWSDTLPLTTTFRLSATATTTR